MRQALILLGLFVPLAGCRSDEARSSGQPYVCLCRLASESEPELSLDVCAIDTGEAMAVARDCAAERQPAEVQFCDCREGVVDFCELDGCLPHPE